MKAGKVIIVLVALLVVGVAVYVILKYGELFGSNKDEVKKKDEVVGDVTPPSVDVVTASEQPSTPSTSTPSAKPKPTSTQVKCSDKNLNKLLIVKKGDKGNEVCAIQKLLNLTQGTKITTDGIFGNKTQAKLTEIKFIGVSPTISQLQNFLKESYGISPRY